MSVIVTSSTILIVDPRSLLFHRRICLCAIVPGSHRVKVMVSLYSGCCSAINPRVGCPPCRGSVSDTAGSCIFVVISIRRSSCVRISSGFRPCLVATFAAAAVNGSGESLIVIKL
jgi:hypothetical protein